MIDAAAIWLPPKPAIIIQREIPELRLVVDNEDAGHMVPADFRAMPWVLRQTVPVHELRKMLPEPYRLLGHGLILSLLGGLPGPMMAGGVKYAWLFTSNGTMTIPGDWNRDDNIIHGVGRGGNGANSVKSTLVDNAYYGGAGGGGSAYAGIVNRIFAFGQQLAVTVATSSGNTSVDSLLIAVSGGNAGSVSGGSSSGGGRGTAAASTGDIKTNGGNGLGRSGYQVPAIDGGGGGGAGGPNGDGADGGFSGGRGDGLQGGAGGIADGNDGPTDAVAGIYGPAGGWNPNHPVNAGSGGGGYCGTAVSYSGPSPAWKHGGRGSEYGAGSGGGGGGWIGSPDVGNGATGREGCVLAINNPSL